MRFLLPLLVCFSMGFTTLAIPALAQQGPQSFAPPKSKPHSKPAIRFDRVPKKFRRSKPDRARQVNKGQRGMEEFGRVWRSSDGRVHFDLQVIYPSSCYKAGGLTYVRGRHWLKRRRTITINAEVNFHSGMCSQSATPIRFSGVIPGDIAAGLHLARFVVTNSRNRHSSEIGPFTF